MKFRSSKAPAAAAMITFLLLILGLASSTFALHASQAGIIDWHKQFIGVPLSGSLAPVFHRVNKTISASSRASQTVILTGTGSNVLAALDPVAGDVAWRYIFDAKDPFTTFRANGGVVAVLSGPGGATLRTFDALTGDLIVERRLHKAELGRLFQPADLGSQLAFPIKTDSADVSNSDVYVLSDGHVLRSVGSLTGEIKWQWSAEDQGSLVIYSKIVPTPDAIYLVGLAKSVASYTLHISIIAPSTGTLITSGDIPSSIRDGLTDFLVLSDSSSARITWLEQGTLKSITLCPELKGKPLAVQSTSFKAIKDVGLRDKGYFVAIKSDDTARVMKISSDGKNIKGISEFPDSASSDSHSDSIYTGGLDKDGFPYIVRVYWSNELLQAVVHIYSPQLNPVTRLTLPFDTLLYGVLRSVALDVTNLNESEIDANILVTTTTGAVQLWAQGRVQWTREESLAEIKVAEFVELPEAKTILSHIDLDGESFLTRLARQILDAKGLPSYLVSFVKRFATGSYASATSSAAINTNLSEPIFRDVFGFRKIIVAATPAGVVFGIDSSSGAILWQKRLGMGWAEEVGGRHQPVKLFVTKSVSDGGDPEVVLLTQRLADNGLVDTALFHFDAMTGAEVGEAIASKYMLQGLDLIQGELVDAFLLSEPSKIVLAIDKYMQVYFYPDTEANRQTISSLAPRLHFPLRANKALIGHQILPTIENTGRFTAYTTWRKEFPLGERIIATIPRPLEPVASLGKVLGNRDTLYKYLNPHLMIVLTIGQSVGSGSCGVYLMDGAKGAIAYHATVPSNDGTCDVHAALTENWLVYSYYDGDISSSSQAKGHRVVSVELYEGRNANDKTRSSDVSVYSNASLDISVYEQSYILPAGVTALAITSTKYGITLKDVIVANHRQQIQSVQKRVLDPRRPKRKPTTEEIEEWLVQYDPLVPDDPRRVISHTYKVAKIERIIASPALLESTSLIFAHGLDMFSTRLAPSHTFDVLNENFNKAQLVLTISGLAIAILMTKPMLQRKRLREKWY